MAVPQLERELGIEVYATQSAGIGGVIRQKFDDFEVEEVLVDGSRARISQNSSTAVCSPLGSSFSAGHHLLCLLIKRNWDTLSAVKTIADQLGISMARVDTAGMKDAKAVTAQHITIEDVTIEDVQKVQVKDVELRALGYVREELSSFYLLGNAFRITVGSISHSRPVVEGRIQHVVQEVQAAGGIPNFFGHQRFGTTRPITHQVGREIVHGDFEKAVMFLLAAPSLHEHPDSRRAREELQSRWNFKAAETSFPKQLRYEHLILRHLSRNPDDFVGALKRLPLNLQKLFVQAYQSFLFNRFLSARVIQGHRLDEAQVGDYVVSLQRNGLPLTSMHKVVKREDLSETNVAIKEGKMKIALPLIGFKQATSSGSQGAIEAQIIEKEGICPSGFRITSIPEISSRGEIRTALASLKDFSLDEISKPHPDTSSYEAKMSFMLHRGSYATVFLRELMKPSDLIASGY